MITKNSKSVGLHRPLVTLRMKWMCVLVEYNSLLTKTKLNRIFNISHTIMRNQEMTLNNIDETNKNSRGLRSALTTNYISCTVDRDY